MPNSTGHFYELLLRLVLPASGRHRATDASSLPHRGQPAPRWQPCPPSIEVRGEDVPLVRPYVLTAEERQQRRLQWQRRRALWLAVNGVDVGPRWIHGVEVPT